MSSYIEKLIWHESMKVNVIPPALTAHEAAFSKINSAAISSSQMFQISNLQEYQAAIRKVFPDGYNSAVQQALIFNELVEGNNLLKYQTELWKSFVWFKKRKVFSKFYGSKTASIFKRSPLFTKDFFIPPFYQERINQDIIIAPETIKVEHNRVKNLIIDIYQDNDLFHKITPREFEEVIAEILKQKGYEVELTKQTRDGGYDIIALYKLAGNMPIKMLVECKRWKHKVDVDVIRSFKHVVSSNNANLGMLATTSFFSPDAKKENEEKYLHLHLKDRNHIITWVDEYNNAFKYR